MKFGLEVTLFLALLSVFVILTNFASYSRASLSLGVATIASKSNQTQARTGPVTIAVCIAGHARTFRHAIIRKQLQSNVIAPLARSYSNNSVVHIFFVLRLDDAPTGKRSSASLNVSEVLTGVNQFNPINVRLIHERKEFSNITGWISRDEDHQYDRFRIPQSCVSVPKTSINSISADKYVRFPHTLWRARQCLQLVRETERDKCMSYDWVYRIRPDVVLLNDVILPDQLHPHTVYTNALRPSITADLRAWWSARSPLKKGHQLAQNTSLYNHSHISDIITIASRYTMDIALSAVEAIYDCKLFQVPTRGGIPENILLYWLLTHHVPVQTLPLEWVIVRDRVGPECKRIKSLSNDDINVTQVLSRCRQFARKIKPLLDTLQSKYQ